MPTQLEQYIKNQDELVEKYNNQLIAVKDGIYIASFKTKTEALRTMIEKGYEPGTFMIILCTPGNGEYTAHFHSNVSFDQVSLN
ncbi:MAG: hypothetical protein LBG48_02125 [Rickettsiales bacterium]|jgi:hypothetical protein|nr:hypothetical protein [Rickettsiales bacterium]